MNKQQARDLIPIMQAFVDGRKIQCFINKIWVTTSTPDFYCGYKWRIRPKEIWGVYSPDSEQFEWRSFSTAEQAKMWINEAYSENGFRIFKL